MTERQDFIALDWVAGEIEETLNQAAQALQAYIANRDDSTKLRFCLTHIHQVQGTLQMVEFFGAALLAEEMEALAQVLSEGGIHSSHVDDALQVLQNAIIQLPLYLDRVKESRHGLPAALLPVMNDLRAVRGESLLSETVLFAPNMGLVTTANTGKLSISADELSQLSNKLRQMFQIALLGLIRGNERQKNLNYLAKVCAKLVKLSEGMPSQSLWKVSIAVLEGLLNSSIESSVSVTILLRQVDRQIKYIIDVGEPALAQPAPEDLLKNLLYYVARSKSNSRFIKEIKDEYNLDASLLGEGELDDDSLSTPDSATMQTVVAALIQELKDIQLAFTNAGASEPDLTNVLPYFRRISDTLAVLGMGSLLKQLQLPYNQLAKILANPQLISVAELNNISAQLASVETELNPDAVIREPLGKGLFNDSEEAQQQLDQAHISVLRESRNGLENAKEAIIEFVANQWDHQCLEELPALLSEISGSLNIINQNIAAEILNSCGHYIQQKLLIENTVPEWQMLDTLADAITSIDYYLERLDDSNDNEGQAILDVATESVAELGYPINELEPQSIVEPTQDNSEQEEHATEVPILADDIVIDTVTTESSVIENDQDFDPEIAEIFVEEAGEVLETIDEFLPQWQADSHDHDKANTVRRAFHTLKGSGRMVGATVIGELAWAIENLLNKVLDGSFTMDEARFSIVKEARTIVPTLVDAYEQRRQVTPAIINQTIEPLIERAGTLIEQQQPATNIVSAQEAEPIELHNQQTDSAEIPVVLDVHNAGELELSPAIDEQDSAEDEIDIELLEIFAAETAVHVQVLDGFISHCYQLAGPAELSDELQRALHTLKGSANMAGIMSVAQVVTPLERVVKELRASQIKAEQNLLTLLERGSLIIKMGVEQLLTAPTEKIHGSDEYIEDLDTFFAEQIAQAGAASADDNSIAPEALNNFLTQSLDLLTELSGNLVLWQQHDLEASKFNQFELLMDRFISHAEAVNMLAPVELGQSTQVLYRRAVEATPITVNVDFFELANLANDSLVDMLDQIAGQQTPAFDEELFNKIQDFEFVSIAEINDQLITEISSVDTNIEQTQVNQELNDELVDSLSTDEDLLASTEVVELDFDATVIMPAIILNSEQSPESDEFFVEDINEPTTEGSLREDSSPADSDLDTQIVEQEVASTNVDDDRVIAAMTDFAKAITSPEFRPVTTGYEEGNDDDDIDDEILEIFLEEADDLLEASDEAIHGWMGDHTNKEYLDDLLRILHTLKGGARLAKLKDLGDVSHDFETSLTGFEGKQGTVDDSAFNDIQQYQDQLVAMVAAIKLGEPVNLAIVVEEPQPIVDGSAAAIEETELEAVNVELEIQPVEETDIRLDVEIKVEPEPVVVLEESQELSSSDDDSDDELDFSDTDFDQLVSDLDGADDGRLGEQSSIEPLGDEEPVVEVSDIQQEILPLAKNKLREISTEQVASSLVDPTMRKGSQEVVKVSAQLLEELVNLAGETSISRGRAEEQISELVFSLDDMQITVDRLQEQVRRLDMETEQQILYRQEQVESEGLEGFDPLEMDRYSQLQQLSRSLLESSSDLIDIKSTLADKSRDMETLLVQQSRINTELQEGLMRSQMVPFSRLVPRLRRITRQISGELNKKVDLHIDNIEGELDRSVLERMVAPLEHMLRNAVGHGIESAAQREASGKSKRGNIRLDLAREGGEIVLTLSDDGAGIDLVAVKNKAIERGLMEPAADLSDHEIMQFILQPGFSTAVEVTQISGRGVGMDVVHSEIKQLGGSMDIDSVAGQGTRFIVRLPFTVSVNRALMVSVGGDSYAIPLNSIEGIVRVSPFELETYYQPDAPMFEYAGQPYLLRYMGALLNRGEKPNLEGQVMPLPVILVSGTEHSVAIQVDGLMASREIVVKPLGPQFSSVQGLSGATVLGDGSVVVILDLLAMIRADASHLHRDIITGRENNEQQSRNLLVMVVDDSVTVRKVTSRFLERQSMDVVLAKDGADAVAQLQEMERIPDLMLLDIEMPRMDGFEVASRVRHNSRLQGIPIIMITSRTGEKHRERALSLGVNEYMGKPYQEAELLETIEQLTSLAVEK